MSPLISQLPYFDALIYARIDSMHKDLGEETKNDIVRQVIRTLRTQYPTRFGLTSKKKKDMRIIMGDIK